MHSAILGVGTFDARTRWSNDPDALVESLATIGLEDLDGLLDLYPITEPFSRLGIGWSGASDGLRVSIVFAFADDDAAAASVGSVTSLYEAGRFLGVDEGDSDSLSDFLAVEAVHLVGRTVEVVLDPAPDVPSDRAIDFLLFGSQPYVLHRG